MATKKRIVYWCRLFRRAVYPPFAVVVGILISFFRIPPAWVPEPLAAALKKLQWLEPPWYAWTILVLVAIIGALLEDAYREHIKHEEHLAKADPPSDILITLDDVTLEAIKDAENNPVPPCSSFLVRVENKGPKRLGDCQLIFGAGRAQYQVSGCFNLRPGEHRSLPVLRIPDPPPSERDSRALLYFLRETDWKISSPQMAWVVPPGSYQVRVLSSDTSPAVLDVTLTKSPEDWTLESANTKMFIYPYIRARSS